MNGVDVIELTEVIEVLKNNKPFRSIDLKVQSVWGGGGRSYSTVMRCGFAGGKDTKGIHISSDAYPFSSSGKGVEENQYACPTEQVLLALSSCLIIGISYNASIRNIYIDSLVVDVDAALDIGGFMGLEAKRNGFNALTLTYKIKADATEDELRDLFDYVQKTSPVLDIVANKMDNITFNVEQTNFDCKEAAS